MIGADEVIIKPIHPKVIQKRARNIILKTELQEIMLRRDSLTGMYKSEVFYHRTREMIKNDLENSFVVACLNVGKLKLVNEIFGRKKGNEVLITIADKIKELLFERGTYTRLESDKFAVCFSENDLSLFLLQKQIQKAVNKTMNNYKTCIKAGGFRVSDRDVPVDTMCDWAQMAIQTIKDEYSRGCAFFDEKMHSLQIFEQKILNEIERAIGERLLKIYLQPIYSISAMKPISAEALVRWEHPELGMVSPGDFIPVLEKNGYITKLDYYVWEEVCRYIVRRRKEGKENIPVSVNISRYTLYDKRLINTVLHLVRKYDINPFLLKFEITESAYTENPSLLIEKMLILKDYGFKIMMDDFGSGYSSLNLLKDFDVDILKIDMKFLENLDSENKAGSIFTSVVRMAKWLNIPVVAEGMETREQLEFIRGVGCDRIQGYYFSKPLAMEDFDEHLQKGFDFDYDMLPKKKRKSN